MENQTPPQAQLVPGKQIINFKPAIDEGTRKWQLSPTDTIEEIRQRLSGYHFSENCGKWIKICEPWMNDWGIGKVSNMMNFYINKNAQLSYLEPDQIENIELAFCGELSEFFRFHFKECGMQKEAVGIIGHMIADTMFFALNRARYGKESQFIENTEQRVITTVEGGQQQNQSPFAKIPVVGRVFK
jgi:hypothetical protein